VIGLQLERIVRGFFKVNVLGALLAAVQQDTLAGLSMQGPPQAKLLAAFKLAAVYPFFLYANFSGYIDIVIGLARLMRVRLPENFDRPFSASSALEFWNRWHITLSNWLKTYVYNPLMVVLMRRVSSIALQPFLGVLCFFVTFFLIGVWHGRTSEFVFFGLLTGAGVSINKLWQLELTRMIGRKGYRGLADHPLYRALGRGLNFVWFSFTLLWFWSNWAEINKLSHTLSAGAWVGVWLAVWMCATAVLTLWEWARSAALSVQIGNEPVLLSRYSRVVYTTALGVVAIVISVLLNQAVPDIVYKAF